METSKSGWSHFEIPLKDTGSAMPFSQGDDTFNKEDNCDICSLKLFKCLIGIALDRHEKED